MLRISNQVNLINLIHLQQCCADMIAEDESNLIRDINTVF